MKTPILIDVDGILADFMGAVLDYANSRFDKNYTHDDMTDDFRIILKDCFDNDFLNFIHCPGFCEMLRKTPWADELIEGLRETDRKIMCVTSPYKDHKTWGYERVKWLEEHFGFGRDEVILTHNKAYVSGLTLIDDLPRNCNAWTEYHGPNRGSVMLVRPWNKKDRQSVQGFVGDNHKEVIETVQELSRLEERVSA